MSDDPKEKTKKLRLSRDATPGKGGNEAPQSLNEPQDVKIPQGPPQPSGPPAAENPAASGVASDQPKSKLKLNRGGENAQGAVEGADSSPSASREPPAGVNEENIDAVQRGNAATVQKERHSILPSLIVVSLLFLLLGASGFGLWKILASPEAAEPSGGSERVGASEDSPAADKVKGSGPKNPIERAKETIATVPKLDMDALSGKAEPATIEPTPKVQPTPVVKPTPKVEPTPRIQAPQAANQQITAPEINSVPRAASAPAVPAESTAAVERTKATVSGFLSSLHIGGMRQGDRPMILIDGRAHTVGDTVQTETGLKFDGFRNGKLAFIDQNDILYLKSF